MKTDDLTGIAKRFLKLPFAFLQEPEIDGLGKDILAARRASDLSDVIERLSQDIQTHETCDNWGKAEHEREVLNDLLDWDGMLSLAEKDKLREIIKAKSKDFSKILSSSVILKVPAWDAFLNTRDIKRQTRRSRVAGKIVINDPLGGYLVMTEKTARKILVLGL